MTKPQNELDVFTEQLGHCEAAMELVDEIERQITSRNLAANDLQKLSTLLQPLADKDGATGNLRDEILDMGTIANADLSEQTDKLQTIIATLLQRVQKLEYAARTATRGFPSVKQADQCKSDVH